MTIRDSSRNDETHFQQRKSAGHRHQWRKYQARQQNTPQHARKAMHRDGQFTQFARRWPPATAEWSGCRPLQAPEPARRKDSIMPEGSSAGLTVSNPRAAGNIRATRTPAAVSPQADIGPQIFHRLPRIKPCSIQTPSDHRRFARRHCANNTVRTPVSP